MPSIAVKHNIEVAHRLSQTSGKCENIHGHSMWVTLTLSGSVDKTGKLQGIEFGDLKRRFRTYLDDNYDHHLLLNKNDKLALLSLPGLVSCNEDPTTENIAAWIYGWAFIEFIELLTQGLLLGDIENLINVAVQETPYNFAEYP